VEIQSDHRFAYAAGRDVVWRAITATDEYQTWWPWLRRFDGHGLVVGDEWTCEVRPPVPYPVRFTITLDEVVDGERVASTIAGDIAGTALLTLAECSPGCELRLTSQLAPSNRFLRSIGALARPLVQFGHDWVITTGARQFERAAL
jgi:uncharacterized protein YndB with AHSA1/START domain